MKNIGIKLAAVALTLGTFTAPVLAGRGGSNGKISSAVASGSVDAIIAEVERAEKLMCIECIPTIRKLLSHDRFEVRQVAAWWFAKRSGLRENTATQFKQLVVNGGSLEVRNAADFLGRVRQYNALPSLRIAITRTDISAEAKLAIVRAVGYMAHIDGNGILITALSDADAGVRVAAITAWRDMLGQVNATPLVGMLRDGDARVRAEAAAVVGAYGERGALSSLTHLVVNDSDAFVRRNAAWALGKIGSIEAAPALTVASTDKSGIVRNVARAALATLR